MKRALLVTILVLAICSSCYAQGSAILPYMTQYIRTLLDDANIAAAWVTLGLGSTDGTFAANSDTLIPTEKAIKTYVTNNSSTPGGSDTHIQYNNNGDFAGDEYMTRTVSDSGFLLLETEDALLLVTDDKIILVIDAVNFNLNGRANIGDGGTTNYTRIATNGTISLFGTAGLNLPHLMQSDTTDQSIADVTLGQAITFDSDVHRHNITRTSSSRFTITKEGAYLITFSAIAQSAVAAKNIAIWMKKNDVNVADSTTYYTFKAANATGIITVTFIYHFLEDDYFEFWMWGDHVGVKLDATAAVAFNEGVLPAIPACPSIIMTANYTGVD